MAGVKQYTTEEFLGFIRGKYPQYNEVDDSLLFNQIVGKYPQYKEMIKAPPPLEKVKIFRSPEGDEQEVPVSQLGNAATDLPGYDLVLPKDGEKAQQPVAEGTSLDTSNLFNYVSRETIKAEWDSLSENNKAPFGEYENYETAKKTEWKNKVEMGKIDASKLETLQTRPVDDLKTAAQRYFKGEITDEEYMQERLAAGKDVRAEAMVEIGGFMGETEEDDERTLANLDNQPGITGDTEEDKEFSYSVAKYPPGDVFRMAEQELAMESDEIHKTLERSSGNIRPLIDKYENAEVEINDIGRSIEKIMWQIGEIDGKLSEYKSEKEVRDGEEVTVYIPESKEDSVKLNKLIEDRGRLVSESAPYEIEYESKRQELLAYDKAFRKSDAEYEANYARLGEVQAQLGSRGFELRQRGISEDLKAWLSANEAVIIHPETEETWAIWDDQRKLFISDSAEMLDLITEQRDPATGVQLPAKIDTQMVTESYLRYQMVNLEEGFSAGTPWYTGTKGLVDGIAANSLRLAGALADVSLPTRLELEGETWGSTYRDILSGYAALIERKTAEVYTPDAQQSTPQGFYAADPKNFDDIKDLKRMSQKAGETIPLFLGLMATYMSSPRIGRALMVFVEGGEQVSRIEQHEKETGNKVHPAVVALASATVGVVNAKLEELGFKALLQKNLTTDLALAEFNEKFLGRLTNAFIGVFTEITTEGWQGANQELAKVLYEEFEYAGLKREMADAFIADAISAVPMAGLGASMGVVAQSHADRAKKKAQQHHDRSLAWEFIRQVEREALADAKEKLTQLHHAKMKQREEAKKLETLRRKEVSRQTEEEIREALAEEAYVTEETMIPKLLLEEEREIIFGLGYTVDQYVRMEALQRREIAYHKIPAETTMEAAEEPVTVEKEEVEVEVPVEEEVAVEAEVEPEVEEPEIEVEEPTVISEIQSMTFEEIDTLIDEVEEVPEVTQEEGKPLEEEPEITDAAEVQRIKSSIQEGETILRAGEKPIEELKSIRSGIVEQKQRIGDTSETPAIEGVEAPDAKPSSKRLIKEFNAGKRKLWELTVRERDHTELGEDALTKNIPRLSELEKKHRQSVMDALERGENVRREVLKSLQIDDTVAEEPEVTPAVEPTGAEAAVEGIDEEISDIFREIEPMEDIGAEAFDIDPEAFAFNDEIYNKVTPVFKKGLESTLEAGETLQDFVMAMRKKQGARWDVVKPYLSRFLKDVSENKIKITEKGVPLGEEKKVEPTESPGEAVEGEQLPEVPPDEKVAGEPEPPKHPTFHPTTDIRTTFEPGEQVSEETKELIRRGKNIGIPEEVLNNQIEDAGLIVNSHDKNKGMFLLASEAGSGKTFILGAAIRELQAKGVTNILYVTMNQTLIKQIESDLAAYGVTGDNLNFMTYSGMREYEHGYDGARYGAIIFDESQNIKNMENKQGGAAQHLLDNADFAIFSSATPFENPTEAQYLEKTGVFDVAGGFFEWARAYGAVIVPTQDGYIATWRPSDAKPELLEGSRTYFLHKGLMSQRDVILPKGLVTSNMVGIEANDDQVVMYNTLNEALLEKAEELMSDGRGDTGALVKAYHMNLMKRILESAKLEAVLDRVREHIMQKRQVVIFTETKSERRLDVQKIIDLWNEHLLMLQVDPDAAPPIYRNKPLSALMYEVANAFKAAGYEVFEIPSVIDVVQKEFGKENVVVYTGSASQKVLEPWRNSEVPIAIATMAKGGTGLSLHDAKGGRPTTQINVSLPWTATKIAQVTGRTARYGLASEVWMEWIFSENIEFDRKLAQRVGQKMISMGAMVQGIGKQTKWGEKFVEYKHEGEVEVEQGTFDPKEQGGLTPSTLIQVFDIPIDNINIDLKAFQERPDPFSEVSVNKIITAAHMKPGELGRFDWNELDPILVWKDDKGDYYVLAGHSRLEAFKRLRKEGLEIANKPFNKIPAIVYEGTKEEAEAASIRSNYQQSQVELVASANKYRNMREEGRTKKDIMADAKLLHTKNANAVVTLSYLDPNGKAIDTIKQFSEGQEDLDIIMKAAKWIGKLRELHPELTTSHENEMFDFLISRGNMGTQVGQYNDSLKFREFVEKAIEKQTLAGEFAADEPLNLRELKAVPLAERRYDEKIASLKKELTAARKELDKQRKVWIYKLRQENKYTEDNLEARLREYNAKIADLEAELLDLLDNEDGKRSEMQKQTSLFDMDSEEIETDAIEDYIKNPAEIQSIAMPELVELVTEFLGERRIWVKEFLRNRQSRGAFIREPKPVRIELKAGLAKDPTQAMKTLAHEIGHMIDWLPDSEIEGSILGRLLVLKAIKDRIITRKGVTPAYAKELRARREKILEKLNYLATQSSQGSGLYTPKTDFMGIFEGGRTYSITEAVDLLNKELGKIENNFHINSKIKEELWNLSTHWRPLGAAIEDLPPSFIKYRESASELYADFISVLLNNPVLAMSMAPKAFKLWHDYIDNKPNFKKKYLELVELSRDNKLLAKHRNLERETTFEETRQAVLTNAKLIRDANKFAFSWLARKVLDKTWGVVQYEKKLIKEGKMKLEDSFLYIINEAPLVRHNIPLEKFNKIHEIRESYREQGLSDKDIADFLFLARAATQRKGLFNPLGYSGAASVETLEQKRKEMGEVQYAKLERVVDQIQEWWLNDVMQYAYNQGWVSKTLWEKIRSGVDTYDLQLTKEEAKEKRRLVKASGQLARIDMDVDLTPELAEALGIPYEEGMTYMVIEEKSVYAPFIPLHHFANSGISERIQKQIGTMSKNMDPFYAMILKGVLITKAAMENGMKRDFAEHTLQFYPKDSGVRVPRKGEKPKPGERMLRYKVEGKPKELIIPEEMDEMFKNAFVNQKFANVMKYPNSLFRALVIVYNPGFVVMNAYRDRRRLLFFYQATKIASNKLWALDVLKLFAAARINLKYLTNLSAAYKKVKDIPHPKIADMKKQNLLFPNFSSIFMGRNSLNSLDYGDLNHVEHLLSKLNVLITPGTSRYKLVNWTLNTMPSKAVRSTLEAIKTFGDVVETLPRVTAYDLLKPMVGKIFANEAEMRYAVRNFTGTPYFLLGGQWKGYMDSIFLFSNIFMQGARSDYYELGGAQAPFEKGKSISNAWRYSRLLTTMFTLAAPVATMFYLKKTDDEDDNEWANWYAKAYRLMSSYDLRSHICIPIGMITLDNKFVPVYKGHEAADMNKVVYLRLPKDETQRMLDGILWTGLRSALGQEDFHKVLTSMLDYGADSIPTKSVIFGILARYGQAVRGKNPVDPFYDSPVFREDEFEFMDGGDIALGMLRWTLEKAGLRPLAAQWRLSEKEKREVLSEVEIASKSIPVLSRFLKVSDQGTWEHFRRQARHINKEALVSKLVDRKFMAEWVTKYLKDMGRGVSLSKMMDDCNNMIEKALTEAVSAEGAGDDAIKKIVGMSGKELEKHEEWLMREFWLQTGRVKYGAVFQSIKTGRSKETKTALMGNLLPEEFAKWHKIDFEFRKNERFKLQREAGKTEEFVDYPFEGADVSSTEMPLKDLVDFIQVAHGANILGLGESKKLMNEVRLYAHAREKYGKNKPGFLKWYKSRSYAETRELYNRAIVND